MFKESEEPEEAPPEEEPELDEDGNPIEKPPKEPIEVFPQHIFIPEVVRDERIHFFKVPKLGSYLAIRLEYNSCLSPDALDAAVQDY